MKYTILEGTFYVLIEKVNQHIKNGWVPQGGLLTAHGGRFYQAMVLK